MEPLVLYTLITLMLLGVIVTFYNIANPNSSTKKAILLGRLTDRTVIMISTILLIFYFSLFGYLVTLIWHTNLYVL